MISSACQLFVDLRCRRMDCHHVAHASCLLDGVSLHSDSEPIIMPAGHPTSYFMATRSQNLCSPTHSVNAASSGTTSALVPGSAMARRRCTFELQLLHLMSHTLVAKFSSPYPVDAVMEATANGNSTGNAARGGSERLLMLQVDSKHQARVVRDKEPTTAMESNPSYVAQCFQRGPEYMFAWSPHVCSQTQGAIFSIARGRMAFRCQSPATHEQWEYGALGLGRVAPRV